MESNEIYNFLKQNNLTQKTEEDFIKEYSSDKNKQSELYNFFVENNLTQKSLDDFSSQYFGSTEGKPTNFTNGSQEPSSPSASAPQSTSPKVEEVPLMLQGKTPEDKYVPTPEEQAIASEQAAKAVAAPVQNLKDLGMQEDPKLAAKQRFENLIKDEKKIYEEIKRVREVDPANLSEEQLGNIKEYGRVLQDQYLDIQNKKEQELRFKNASTAETVGASAVKFWNAIIPTMINGASELGQAMSRLDYMTPEERAAGEASGDLPMTSSVSEEDRRKNIDELVDKVSLTLKPEFNRDIFDDAEKAMNDPNFKFGDFMKSLMLTSGELSGTSLGIAGATAINPALGLTATTLMTSGEVGDLVNSAKGLTEKEKGQAFFALLPFMVGLEYVPVADVLKRAGGNAAQKEVIEKLSKELGEDFFKQKLGEIGKAAANVGLDVAEEAIAEGANPLVQEGMKYVVNTLKDKEVFKYDEDIVTTVLKNAGLGALGGTTTGGVIQGSSFLANNQSDYSRIAEFANNPENIKDLKDALQIAVNKDIMSQGKAEEILTRAESIAATANSIPAKLSTEKQMQAFNLIEERKGIEVSIEGKDKAIVTAEKEQIDAINRELAVLGGAKREEGEVLYSETKKQQDNANKIIRPEEISMGEQPQTSEGVREQNTQEQTATQQGQEKNQEEVTPKTTNTNEENGIQEGGESGNEVISQGLQGEGKEGGQNVQEQEKALPQEVSSKSQSDALKDVESTAKALELNDKSIDDIDLFYNKIQDSRNEDVRVLSNMLDNISEKKERELILNNPLSKVSDNVDSILSRDSFVLEKPEGRAAKQVAKKYQGEVSKNEAIQDFKDAFFGNPSSNIADALKMRESVRVYIENGGTLKDLLSLIKKEFEADGFTEQDAAGVINGKIRSLSKTDFRQQQLSEAYHQAKKDGSNPELVAAVEELLGQKTEGVNEGVNQVQPDTKATKESLAEKYAKVESAKLQGTVTEDLKSGYTQKEIREALSEAGIDKAVSSTLISEAKQANALEKLTEVADAVSKSMKVKNLTKESFVELVKDLASKTKELQKVLEVLRKKPDLSKAEVMRINSLANLEKLGKMGANELFDLIEQVNRSAERRGKNSKLKDLFKKLNKVKDLVGGKGSQIDIMTKTNPNIFTEEQIDRAIELLEPIVASGKNINAKQLKEASKGIKEILDEKDLLVKNENLLVNEALGQLQSKLGEDYDLEDFIEAMKIIYGLSKDDTIVKILASRESLKRAYRYFNNVSNPVDPKELEKEKEQNKEEKSAKKIEEIMSVRAIVQSKIAQLKSAKIMQMLKDNGFGLLELEDVNTLLNVSPETFSRLSLSDLNQLSNILDNLSDGFYNGISGRLVAKISGLDEVIKIEKRSKTIKSAIDRTKLDIINAIKNGRDKISAELGAAKDKEATAQRKAKQKLDIYYKTIGSMSNLFDVISRNVVRPVIDAVDAALSKADTFTVKVSKDFVEAMVNAKNKWDKDVSNSKFRKKVKEKYGFDPKSASPDLIMVMLTTELQHLANNEDKTSYPAKNIISVRGLAGIDDVNRTSYGGNQHLQELKEAFIDKDGVLDLKKTNEFLQEFGFDKPILKARELMKTMRPYAVTASMRNYGVALDAREDYTPRGQQGYTDTEQAILDLLSPESYGIGVNSPNLFARTATFGENVEWDFQKLITRYVDTIAKELYVKPVIRKNQVVVNELKQTGNSNAQTLAYVLEAMIETLKADGKPSSFATKNPTMYRLIQTLKLNILSSNFKYVSETSPTLLGQFVANPKDIVRGIQLWGKGFGKSEQEGDDILSKLMSVARGSSNSAAIFAIQERQIENREQIKTSTSGTVIPQESRTIVQRLTDSLKTSKFNQLLRDKAIKSNTKLQRNLDKIPRGVGWLGAFDRRFEELTGSKFDYDKIDDPAYIAENSDAISESQSHADTRVKKFVGPGSVREASMEFKERSPFTKDFQLWSLITSQEARDSIRKIARGISGKSEEEILQEVGDLTGYLVQSIGSRTAKAAIRLTIYSIVAEVAKRMTGDDDDREKADKLLDKLTSPEFYAASLLAGIKDIALGGRNPFVRFMIDVAIERTYSMLFKEKQSKERKIDELEEQNLMDISTVMGDFVTPPDLIRSYGSVGSVVSDIMRFGINYSSANEDDKAEKEYERKKLERAIAEVHGENSDMLKVVNDSYEMQEQLQERLKKNDFVSEEEKTKAITNLKISQGVTSVLLRMVSATTGIPYYQDIAQVTSTAAEEWLKDSASKLRTINETINKEFYGDDYNSWMKNNKIISGTGWSLEAQKKAAKELKELNDKYSSIEQAGRFLNITDKVLMDLYKQ